MCVQQFQPYDVSICTVVIVQLFNVNHQHSASVSLVNIRHLTTTKKAAKLTLVKRQHLDSCCGATDSLVRLWR